MFDDLFTRPGIIGRYLATPLFGERLSYLTHCAQGGARRTTLRKIAADQVNLVHLLDLREGERVSVDADRSRDGFNGRCPAGVDAAAPPSQNNVGGSSVMPCDGCASWTCWKNPMGRNTPMLARSRSSPRGCATSAGGRKTRFMVAAERSTTSSFGSTNGASPWLRSETPTSIGLSRAGTPAISAGSRSMTTHNVFALSSDSPNTRAGAHPGWATGSCPAGSIRVRQFPRG